MTSRLPLVLATITACGDPQPREIAKHPVETAIARDLTARFGTPVTTRCIVLAGLLYRCESELADGTKLPIAIESEGREWAWRIDGIVIATRSIADHVTGVLADLRVPQTVDCGAPIHVARAGDRIACKLGGGGLAFVRVAADGSTSLELALDPEAASARGELVTPERERELLHASQQLETLMGESDGEDEVQTADGGVPSP